MVRLVFRPYTQIWRSICTSESLRASTRVSPGFTLFRHSSPSFGSQHTCSHSDLFPMDHGRSILRINFKLIVIPQLNYINLYFHCAQGFDTLILAFMLDSLVRVSRRAGSNHFLNIPSIQKLYHIVTHIQTQHCKQYNIVYILEHNKLCNKAYTVKSSVLLSTLIKGYNKYNRNHILPPF